MKKKSSNSIGVNRAFLRHPLSALRAYCLHPHKSGLFFSQPEFSNFASF
jgi:hypothetical protein